MANPPKKKGTGGETELLRLLENHHPGITRTQPGELYDLRAPGELPPFQILATRPDRGQWLITMSLDDYLSLTPANTHGYRRQVHIEVKRYARFSLHTIFEKKFGKSR